MSPFLRPGLIVDIARAAGLTLRSAGGGTKFTLKCPCHDDRTASAFVSNENNVFFCSVCTPAKGWTAKQFCAAVGQPWIANTEPSPRPVVHVSQPRARAEVDFTPSDSAATWAASFARARDDEQVEADRDVHDYVARRGLGEALELGGYGVVPTSGLHPALARWPGSGHRVVAPLFDAQGEIASIQARSILPDGLKTMNPKGSRVAGTVFADRAGQRVLAGERAERIVFGEGLTDLLALCISSPWPVLTAPGTSNAVNAVGAWAGGAEVLLALDSDAAGEAAVEPVAQRLFDHGARSVRRVEWPGKVKDACEVLTQYGDVGLHEFLKSLGNGGST